MPLIISSDLLRYAWPGAAEVGASAKDVGWTIGLDRNVVTAST